MEANQLSAILFVIGLAILYYGEEVYNERYENEELKTITSNMISILAILILIGIPVIISFLN